ncbi:MAG TPA: undecaprenyldiphospho-muramoylpentapeptide beta-N-acetylglucosaminyltransferase [Usitatibacteraceae bacterium]|nr:undecaprenyldiphospho-muramoylpentapeptide beta-N-acetylglucosaminyltransferase [Usitatibacteraceae bacterium]HQY45740.1 undecaprenyldiphospho-muramoylpentapeptide beta-N-acetylglucosaminyltransferase [Usitatibacteraceae bacterium]
MSRTILVMAAGTGGHIFPGLAIARELAARGWKVAWMGTPAGMEGRLVAQAGYPMEKVAMTGVRGKGKLAWLLLPARLLVAFWQATAVLFRVRPDVVLSMGGYVAFPGGMMAALWGKPLVVHEPGATAGLANRALALVADRVVAGMEGAFEARTGHGVGDRIPRPKRVEWLGTPVREEIAGVAPPPERYAGRAGPLRLLVVGGSLGAQTLNDLVVAALAAMPEGGRPEVVHQAGSRNIEALRAAYAKAGVKAEAVDFIDDMAARYAWCDVLVARSGAITVAEIAVAGVAAILFPLPWFVADEQAGNARFLETRGAAIRLSQLETTPAALAGLLSGLTREKLAAMATAARSLGKPDATRRCADLCEALAA